MQLFLDGGILKTWWNLHAFSHVREGTLNLWYLSKGGEMRRGEGGGEGKGEGEGTERGREVVHS